MNKKQIVQKLHFMNIIVCMWMYYSQKTILFSGFVLHTFNDDLITIDYWHFDIEKTKFIFGMNCTQL